MLQGFDKTDMPNASAKYFHKALHECQRFVFSAFDVQLTFKEEIPAYHCSDIQFVRAELTESSSVGYCHTICRKGRTLQDYPCTHHACTRHARTHTTHTHTQSRTRTLEPTLVQECEFAPEGYSSHYECESSEYLSLLILVSNWQGKLQHV